MISSLDYKIFEAIQQDKKLTEIYLGYQELDWYYTKARYSATCTEAIEFTLFDKTICGLLQTEEYLSLEDIGGILGFNVIDNPSEKKYKDNAEYEILKEALQSLQEYEMIEGGDIDFSYCTLTKIGKEYVEKGKKFKIHEDKEFDLFFDYTSEQHDKAKENFEFIKGERAVNNENIFDYENEEFLKSFAEKQIPEIYNPEKLNSFKDTICINKSHYKTVLYRIYLLNISTGKHRVLVFDCTSNKINEFFTDYIRTKNDLIDFNSFVATEFKIERYDNVENKLIENLIDFQDKIDLASEDENTENILSVVNDYYNNSEYIEQVKFFNEIGRFIEISGQEIWLLLNNIGENEIKIIKQVIDNNTDKFFFVYLENAEITQQFYNEINESTKEYKNVYILLMDDVAEFNVIFKNKNNIWNVFKKTNSNIHISIEGQLNQIKKEFIHRNITDIDLEENYLIEYRSSFAKEYVPIIDENIKEYFNTLNLEKETNKSIVEEIRNVDKRLSPFKELDNSQNYFKKLESQKQEYINKILQNRKEKIDTVIAKISKKFFEKDNPTIDFVEKLENQLNGEKLKCLEEEHKLFLDLETKLKIAKKDIEIASKRKSIIIDTNILLEEPLIIEVIGQHQTIVFSGKVIDELDNLKIKPALKDKAQNAIRNIHKHQQDKNIRFNTSKLENLPSDFNKKSPDNIILSVALQYLKRNPILLTNDKGMNIKAKLLDIPAKTINELKAILDLSKIAYSNKNNKNTNRNKKRK
jgi:PIN domain